MATGIYKRTEKHKEAISKGLIERNKKSPNPGNFPKGHIPWHKGKKDIFSKETLQKMSRAKKGKKIHPNTQRALIEANRGNKHTLGYKHSEIYKEKTSKRMKGNRINLGRKLSEDHKLKISSKLKGEKSYRWKGGITPINNKIRSSRKYRQWETNVNNRDEICQKCETKKKIMAHHILNFSSHIDKRFNLDNGITFCKTCHRWFHSIYGTKNNTRDQLEEFLTDKYERTNTNN